MRSLVPALEGAVRQLLTRLETAYGAGGASSSAAAAAVTLFALDTSAQPCHCNCILIEKVKSCVTGKLSVIARYEILNTRLNIMKIDDSFFKKVFYTISIFVLFSLGRFLFRLLQPFLLLVLLLVEFAFLGRDEAEDGQAAQEADGRAGPGMYKTKTLICFTLLF